MRYRHQRTFAVRMSLFIMLFVGLTLGPALLMNYFYFERICQVYAEANNFGESRYSPDSKNSVETCFFERSHQIQVQQLVDWKHPVIRVLWQLYLPLGAFGLTMGIFLVVWFKLKWFEDPHL